MTAGIICIDANVVVGLVSIESPDSPYKQLWTQWEESEYQVVAPALIYYEVSNAFHRLTIAGELRPERASQAMEAALSLDITIYGDKAIHRRALNLASSLQLLPATYDAHYLALSEQLSAQFWTADKRLFRAVQATLDWVHLVE